MPIYSASVRNAAQTLSAATTEAATLARQLGDALGRATTYRDDSLSETGLAAKRAELRTEFRAAGGNDLAALNGKVTAAAKYLAEQAVANLPMPADAVGMMQLSNKWANVERLLNAGKDIRAILADADITTALAVREFGGAWIEASSFRPADLWEAVEVYLGKEKTSPNAWLERAVNARIAEITPDANLAELLRAANIADAQVATARPYLDAAESFAQQGAGNLMGAAIASAQIARETGLAPASAPVAA